ncbi:MAG: FHA domain-containing protein [Myxococcota bacterium]
MPPPPNQPPRRRATTGAPGAPRPSGAVPRRTASAPARPAARRAPQAKLVCEAGPSSGQEFTLEGDEVVIGRAADNPVSIPDTSVSRKHALVRKTGDGWAVSDLGSGNGTLLNGEAVSDETPLSNGDVIRLGDSELRFDAGEASADGAPDDTGDDSAEAGAAPSRRPPVRTARTGGSIERSTGRGRPVRTSRMQEDPEAARQKKRKIFIAIGGGLVVVLALLVGWKAIDNKRKAAQAIALKQQREHEAEMAAMFKEAKDLVRQGNWADAKAKLVEMTEVDPEYEAKQVANYLEIAEREIPAQKSLETAREAIKAGEVGKAFKALSEVKTTTQENAVRTLKNQLDDKIAEKLTEARALLPFANELAKMEQLKAISEDILVVRPEDRDAKELQKQADTAIYRIKNPTIAPPPPDRPWVEVQQRFKNGDATGALSLAQACANKHAPCRQLESQIKEFDAKSKKLESLNENELISLYALDKKIAGGESSDLSKQIRTQLVSKLFVKASQAKTTGNWSRAIELARKVLEADPGHVGAQSLVNEARTQAKDVYLRGYQLKETNPDEAIRLFKDVMNMTPPDDEYHQKAKTRVLELQKQ